MNRIGLIYLKNKNTGGIHLKKQIPKYAILAIYFFKIAIFYLTAQTCNQSQTEGLTLPLSYT